MVDTFVAQDTLWKKIKESDSFSKTFIEEVEATMQESCKIGTVEPEVSQEELMKFRFSSLKVDPEGSWKIYIGFLGLVDNTTREYIGAHDVTRSGGVAQHYDLNCIFLNKPFIFSEEYFSYPTSDVLLGFIRRCIVKASTDYSLKLPGALHIGQDLYPHEAALRPFLDKLPSPFTWRLESLPETQFFGMFFFRLRADKLQMYFERAKLQKAAGNVAFEKGERETAISCYRDAASCLTGPLNHRAFMPEDEGFRLLAIVHANLASSYLKPGEGMDRKQAVADANQATLVDPTYMKGYLRLSQAYEAQGKIGRALEAVKKGLEHPKLKGDQVLQQRSRYLLTLPEDEEELLGGMRNLNTGKKANTAKTKCR